MGQNQESVQSAKQKKRIEAIIQNVLNKSKIQK